MKTIGYVRVSTGLQDVDSQKNLLLKFAQQERLIIDFFIESESSSRLTPKERKIDELTNILESGDVLLVTELSRLARNMLETLTILQDLSARMIKVVFVRQPELSTTAPHGKLLLSIYAYFAEAERDFISLRTKAGLEAAKVRGVKLGRPTGVSNKRPSQFEPHRAEIIRYLKQGVPILSILRIINGEREKDKKLSYTAIRYYISTEMLRIGKD